MQFTDQRAFDGIFQELTPTQLRFRAIVRPSVQEAHFADLAIPRDSLSRIWVRSGTHWRTGAFVGAGAFAVMGFLFMVQVGPNCECNQAAFVAYAPAAFALSGAVLGGVAGSLFSRWRVVWPL